MILVMPSARRGDRRAGWSASAIAALTTTILGAQPGTSPGRQHIDAVPLAFAPGPIVKPQAVMQLDDVEQAAPVTDILVRALGDSGPSVASKRRLAWRSRRATP